MSELNFEGCFRFALAAHSGHTDAAGRPYIGHVLRVWRNIRPMGVDIDTQKAAVLHDVITRAGRSSADLAAAGVGAAVLEAVVIFSRTGEPDYYERVAAHPIAMPVKLADICDIVDPLRLAVLEASEADRLRQAADRELELLGHPGFADPLGGIDSEERARAAALVREIQQLHR